MVSGEYLDLEEFYCFTNDKIVDWSIIRAFTDDNLDVVQSINLCLIGKKS